MASGVILVAGVMRIRIFFREHDATKHINSSVITWHAVAFGLFLFSIALWAFAMVLYVLFTQNSGVNELLSYTLVIVMVLGAVAEMFMCVIFYQWSTKSPHDVRVQMPKSESESYVSIETASIDTDFEMNARIWNSLVN